CIVSEIEHESVLAPASMYKTAVAPVRSNGIIDPQILNKLINDQTVLISVMYANNEIGTIQPLREVAALVSVVRTIRQKNSNPLPLYFHTDAAQATAYLDIHVHSLGVDLMTI